MRDRRNPDKSVVLTKAPPTVLKGLPIRDREAIVAIVGKPIHLLGYDECGRAELEFPDQDGMIHAILVVPELIRVTRFIG